MTKKKQESTALATMEALPPALIEELGRDIGAGFEAMTADDYAIPFLRVLQALSPQLDPSHLKHVEGAKAGQILETSRGALYDRVDVVLCAYKKRVMEWVPRQLGGGFVQEHLTPPDGIEPDPTSPARLIDPKTGNEFRTTAIYYVLYRANDSDDWQRAMITMESTQLKHSRKLNSMAAGMKMIIHGEPRSAPMFLCLFTLGTCAETNKKGTFHSWTIDGPRNVIDVYGPDVYRAAKAFASDVVMGAVEENHANAPDAGSADDSDDIL